MKDMKKISATANGIMEQCRERGLTFEEMELITDLLRQCTNEAKMQAMDRAGELKFSFTPIPL